LAISSLRELDVEYMSELAMPAGEARVKRKYSLSDFLADSLFYAAIFVILLTVLMSDGYRGTPKVIMGYSYYTVLSGSMRDEIPMNSLILVKSLDPGELVVGDSITFMSERNKTVTHKIVEIYENYENDGGRGFKTQGVNNLYPDDEIVHEQNVVGKVILVLPGAGAWLRSFVENIQYIYVILGLCLAFSFFIRGVFRKKNTI